METLIILLTFALILWIFFRKSKLGSPFIRLFRGLLRIIGRGFRSLLWFLGKLLKWFLWFVWEAVGFLFEAVSVLLKSLTFR